MQKALSHWHRAGYT